MNRQIVDPGLNYYATISTGGPHFEMEKILYIADIIIIIIIIITIIIIIILSKFINLYNLHLATLIEAGCIQQNISLLKSGKEIDVQIVV